MAYELLGNLGESTLNGAINNSVTTLTVTSATPFPAAVTGTSQFRVIVGTEIMIVTNVSGTTFTVTRGAESTTAASHSSGDAITHVITAGTLSAMFGGGTAGQVLAKTASADYAQAWTTPGYGGGDYFRSGFYSPGLWSTAVTTTIALTLNLETLRPFLVPVRRAFDRIGVNVTAAATAASGGVLRMGIYASSGGLPGALVVDGGTISSETTGAKEITINQTLDPGVYWISVTAQVAVCTVTALSANLVAPFPSTQTAPFTGAGLGWSFTKASVSGALPDPAAATSANASASPFAALRAA